MGDSTTASSPFALDESVKGRRLDPALLSYYRSLRDLFTDSAAAADPDLDLQAASDRGLHDLAPHLYRLAVNRTGSSAIEKVTCNISA